MALRRNSSFQVPGFHSKLKNFEISSMGMLVTATQGRVQMQVERKQLLGYLSGESVQRCATVPQIVEPRWIFPFSVVSGSLGADLLRYLQDAPEFAQPYKAWRALRHPEARTTGFEEHGPAIELIQHCKSQDHPLGPCKGLSLFGLDASQPAPLRFMAFRHALVRVNATMLRHLQEALKVALSNSCSEIERKQFGHTGGDTLVLGKEAFSFATFQLRWGHHGPLTMGRHVDGGPSLLHLSLSLAGRRKFRSEALSYNDQCSVEVQDFELGPGDVYVTSPACFYHSVRYEAQGGSMTSQLPSDIVGGPETVVLHLRSNILRLRSNPSTFKASNRMLSECLAPAVAQALAAEPIVLPSLADVLNAEAELQATRAHATSPTSVPPPSKMAYPPSSISRGREVLSVASDDDL